MSQICRYTTDSQGLAVNWLYIYLTAVQHPHQTKVQEIAGFKPQIVHCMPLSATHVTCGRYKRMSAHGARLCAKCDVQEVRDACLCLLAEHARAHQMTMPHGPRSARMQQHELDDRWARMPMWACTSMCM